MKHNNHPLPWYCEGGGGSMAIVRDANGQPVAMFGEGEILPALKITNIVNGILSGGAGDEIQDGIDAVKRGDVVPHEEVVRELGGESKPPDVMAFPHNGWEYKGMTLRDWFAGQALAAGTSPTDIFDDADLVMAEREKRVNGTA